MRLSGLRASQQWPWHKKSVVCACLCVCFETVPPLTAQTSLSLFLLLTLSLKSRSPTSASQVLRLWVAFNISLLKHQGIQCGHEGPNGRVLLELQISFFSKAKSQPRVSRGVMLWKFQQHPSDCQIRNRLKRGKSDTRSYWSNPGKRRSWTEPWWWSWRWWERIQLSIWSEGQTNKTGWCRGCGP